MAWLRGDGADARRSWQGGYVRRIAASDGMAAAVAAVVGYLVRFGPEVQKLNPAQPWMWLVGLMPLVWVGAMLVARTYERRFLWIGAEKSRRVFSAAVALLAGVGAISWACSCSWPAASS